MYHVLIVKNGVTANASIIVAVQIFGGFATALMVASDIAQELKEDITVSFDFEGRTFTVDRNTDIDVMMRHYFRPVEVTGTHVGPNPNPTETELDRRLALERAQCLAARLAHRA